MMIKKWHGASGPILRTQLSPVRRMSGVTTESSDYEVEASPVGMTQKLETSASLPQRSSSPRAGCVEDYKDSRSRLACLVV